MLEASLRARVFLVGLLELVEDLAQALCEIPVGVVIWRVTASGARLVVRELVEVVLVGSQEDPAVCRIRSALFKNVDPSRLHPIHALQITEFEQRLCNSSRPYDPNH